MAQFKGTGVAIVTPFDDNKNVDTKALKKLVNHIIDGKVDYIVVLGTTGESATLNSDEKRLVMDTVLEVNNGKLPLVIGIGGNNTANITATIQNTDLIGFDAILSVSPYYNKPTQEGIYKHYQAIAECTEKDIILYNVPGRTASNILPETTLRLANDFKNIVAVKEASGNIEQSMQIIQNRPDNFYVISGDDALTLPLMAAGADGVISVVANAFPLEYSNMVRAALANDFADARKWHYSVYEIIDYLFAEGNPAGVKQVLAQLGILLPNVRLPLVETSEELNRKIAAFLAKK